MLDFLPNELTPDEANQLVEIKRKGQLIDMNNLPDELTTDQADQLLSQVAVFGMPTQSGFRGDTGKSISVPGQRQPMTLPVQGRISQKYGVPVSYEKSGYHGGIDVAIAEGTPIPDKVGGIVAGVEDNKGGFGKSVLVKGNDGVTRRYSHLSVFNVEPGQTIPAGSVVGLSGNTGYSTGPHLDYREYKGE